MRLSPRGRTRKPRHYDLWFSKAWHDECWPREPARPYRLITARLRVPLPSRGWTLLDFHDCLAQLGRPQLATTHVYATRVRATDVVPLPDGIRGRWEGWSLSLRLCAHVACRKSLPPTVRADARFCPGGACRQAAYRQRQAA